MNLDAILNIINKKVVFLGLILFLIIIYLIKIFYTATIGVDAGYFLSITRDWVLDNKMPYSDISTAYTPLGYFIYSFVFMLFNDPKIEHFYIFNLLLNLLATLIIFKTFIILEVKNFRIFTIIFFLSISPLIFDIKLEIFIIFLNAFLLFYMSKYENIIGSFKYLVSVALILFLIFFSKQYGLISMLYVFLYLYVKNANNWLKYLSIISLLFLTILSIVVTFFVIYGAEYKFILSNIIGKSELHCTKSYGQFSFMNFFFSLKYYKYFPLFFLTLLIVIKNRNYHLALLALVILIIGLFPFYFQLYPHYIFYGFVFVFIFSILQGYNEKIFNLGILYIMCVNVYSLFIFFNTLKIGIRNKENLIAMYKQVNSIIPKEGNTLVIGSQDIYFGSQLSSLNPKYFGYNFYDLDIIKCNLNYLETGDYFLINPYKLNSEEKVIFSCSNFTLIGEFFNPKVKTKNYIYKFTKI